MSRPLYALANGEIAPLTTVEAIAANKVVSYDLQLRLGNFWLLKKKDGIWDNTCTLALDNYKRLRAHIVPSIIEEKGIGPITAKDLVECNPVNLITGYLLEDSLATKIFLYMMLSGYTISTSKNEANIVYVRGLNHDGTLNSQPPFVFRDRRMVMGFSDIASLHGSITTPLLRPSIRGNWLASTVPGEYWWENAENEHGCAVLQPGQAKAWITGWHHKQHPCLVQDTSVTVLRGTSKYSDTGIFGINHHTVGNQGSTNDYSYGDEVVNWSAGCQVGACAREHYEEFMPLILNDPRECNAPGSYHHYSTLIEAQHLNNIIPL